MTKKPLKIVLGVLAGLLLLPLVGLGVVIWKLDSRAKHAVESGFTETLGQETTTRFVHVSLLNANIGVSTLRVTNLDGYKAPHLLSVGDVNTSVEYASLWTDTLRVPEIEINDMELYIEQKGLTNNVSQLMQRLKKRSAAAPPDPSGKPAKKLQVDRVVLRRTVAHVQLLPLVGKASAVKVEIPEMILDEVTPEGTRAVVVGELMRRILPAVVAAVAKNGRGVLPIDLVGDLSQNAASLVADLGGEAGKLLEQVVKDPVGSVLKAPEALGDKLKEGADKILGGDKKE